MIYLSMEWIIMLNVLVTGANGFIGTNLIKELHKNKDINVLVFTKDNNLEDLKKLIVASDFIFHLAGEVRPNSTKEDFANANITLTENIINLLEENSKKTPILLASTIHAKLLKNEYGKTKRESEIMVEGYVKKHSINSFIFRLPHVFGEGCKPNYNSVITTWIYNSLHDLEINVFDRDIKMHYVYVQDIVSEFIFMLSAKGDTIYYDPQIIYETTLGEVVDFIHEFKQYIDDQDYIIHDNAFKQKLFNTYKYYASKEM